LFREVRPKNIRTTVNPDHRLEILGVCNMPTYDYECTACEHTFELFQSISEPVKRKCPECGRLKLRRLFGTGAALLFKGSGFYQTDYRSESYKKGVKAEKSASESKTKSNGDGASSGKSDSGSKPKAEATA
jgi:putative FmdB family regulatory protein